MFGSKNRRFMINSMVGKRSVFSLGFLMVLSLVSIAQPKVDVAKIFKDAEKQYKILLAEHRDSSLFPFSLKKDGTLKDSKSEWWTSGFFPGTLWYIYEYSKKEEWKVAANRWTLALKREQWNTTTHDLGFMLYCSYGNGLRLTGNKAYVSPLLNGAKSLSTRFHENVGLIKSWDRFPPNGPDSLFAYPVIIDNMMNLEYLTWASKYSGNKRFATIAMTHANNTLKNHFRKDNSCYHAVCYGDNGKVLAKKTWQGFSDSSSWARGQAWAIYGYTMMYRETKKIEYLQQAEKVAKFYLNHPNLPTDKIPYWDFNAPKIPNEERDASAAAVVASALLELSGYVPAKKQYYFNAAETMLNSLSSNEYTYPIGEGHGYILKHSVGFKPKGGEIDVPLVYADYYYLEAILRYKKLKMGNEKVK